MIRSIPFLMLLLMAIDNASAQVIPNDPYFYRQWALHNDGSFKVDNTILGKAGADIQMTEAWEIEKGDSSIIVAILDTGCKLKHKELEGRIWRNKKEIAGNGIDDDGNGYIDDINGWNFQAKNNDLTDNDSHGTPMAGIIAANPNNGVGLAGMDWECKLMICKTSDSSGTKSTEITEAIYYAVNNGARVINISQAGKLEAGSTKNAIEFAYTKGVTVIAGVGNGGIETIYFPAANSKAIAVGATNPDDTRSNPFFWGGGSNYGKELDVVAPGNYVFELDHINDDNFKYYGGGSSSSTAFVSGLASLLLAKHPQLTPDQIRQIITETAEDQIGDPKEDTPGWDKYYGHGRINALKALSYPVSSPVKDRIVLKDQLKVIASGGHGSLRFKIPVGLKDLGTNPSLSIWNGQGKRLLLSTQIESDAHSSRILFQNPDLRPGAYAYRLVAGRSVYQGKFVFP